MKKSFHLGVGLFFIVLSFQNCSFQQNFDINKVGFKSDSINGSGNNSSPENLPSQINSSNNDIINTTTSNNIGPDGSMKIESFVPEDHQNAVYPTFSVYDPQVCWN